MMHYKWIVFDAMGVIFKVGNDTDELLIPFIQARLPQANPEHIQAMYHQTSLGQITTQAFWQQIGLGADYPRIESEYLDTCLTLDPLFKQIAAELSQEFSLAILSNDAKEWSFHLRQRYGLDQLCKEAVISGDVGHRKPSRAIYEILLERLNAPAEECIFIDDRIPNLLAATEIGMTSIWYRRELEPENPDIPYSIQSFAELPDMIRTIQAE